MNHIQLFNVAPAMPKGLEFLERLSRNLWWCWHHDAIELFQRVDHALWHKIRHNAVEFLGAVAPESLEKLARDEGFMAHLKRVEQNFEKDVVKVSNDIGLESKCNHIAYFSLEYGIHESVRIYSGGLGCLSGDHLKTASDMNMPLLGVGLLYRQGYFQQYLNDDGWQQEAYRENEIQSLPLQPACGPDGVQISVEIPLPGDTMHAVVWRLDVGSVPLFLLDANVAANSPEVRQVAARLYEPDRTIRLRQEILLGIGGFQALEAMTYRPAVYHMNEGHAAFLSLARVSRLMKQDGLALDAALEYTSRTGVFTTHTPVPAGNETFSADLVRAHIEALEGRFGISANEVLKWGRGPHDNHSQIHSMTIMALKTAQLSNGVSQLHGVVARQMWQHLWPERPTDEVPIGAITNGVHVPSWLSTECVRLFDKYLGSEWREDPYSNAVIEGVPTRRGGRVWCDGLA